MAKPSTRNPAGEITLTVRAGAGAATTATGTIRGRRRPTSRVGAASIHRRAVSPPTPSDAAADRIVTPAAACRLGPGSIAQRRGKPLAAPALVRRDLSPENSCLVVCHPTTPASSSPRCQDGVPRDVTLDLSYAASKDEAGTTTCGLDPLTCFGTTSVNTLSLGGMLFYRFNLDWFVIAGASVGSQGITVTDPTDGPTRQPRILLTSGFLRVAYRF